MSKKGRKQLESAKPREHAYNRLDAVKEWLTQNYEVRVNLLDRSKVYLSPTETCSFEYKHPVTEEDVVLHAYAEEINVPRGASVCFTSNKNHRMGGFIRIPDSGMLRRLAVIEVDAIDDYRQRLDVDQLWAEAVMLLEGGFNPI